MASLNPGPGRDLPNQRAQYQQKEPAKNSLALTALPVSFWWGLKPSGVPCAKSHFFLWGRNLRDIQPTLLSPRESPPGMPIYAGNPPVTRKA